MTPKPKISEKPVSKKPVKSKPKKIVTPKPIKKEKPVTQKLKKEEAKDKNKFKKYLKKINRSDEDLNFPKFKHEEIFNFIEPNNR